MRMGYLYGDITFHQRLEIRMPEKITTRLIIYSTLRGLDNGTSQVQCTTWVTISHCPTPDIITVVAEAQI